MSSVNNANYDSNVDCLIFCFKKLCTCTWTYPWDCRQI